MVIKPSLNKRYMDNLKVIKNEFNNLTPMDRINVLFEYTDYINSYPDTHDGDCYPVCFWEWYQNDYNNED